MFIIIKGNSLFLQEQKAVLESRGMGTANLNGSTEVTRDRIFTMASG